MYITPIKVVQIHESPFKNTCERLSNWINPYCTIFSTSQDKRRVGLLLTPKVVVANCQDEVVSMTFEKFGEVRPVLFGCVPNTNLSFYYLAEEIEHHGFRPRKRNLTSDSFLFGFLPYAEPCFYRFQPIDVDDSKMFKAFSEDKELQLSCDSIANAIPIWDMGGRLYGFSVGNYNDESAVISFRDIKQALKK